MSIYRYSNKNSGRFNIMDNMEMQREAIIEIVGTQYNNRANNHKNLVLSQKLLIKHQNDNTHDRNAVSIMTKEGKELGFMPKGYASLYAPAIDSGKYSFTVEVLKTEFDYERPILIVKVISESNDRSEDEVENSILDFVHNIANSYIQSKNEYLEFINTESFALNELITSLNRARLLHRLYSISNSIIGGYKLIQAEKVYTPYTKDELIKTINDLKTDVSAVLRKIQKAYNESLEIDDEDEYQRIQSEIRERRKKFKKYDDVLTSLRNAEEEYVSVKIPSSETASHDNIKPEQAPPVKTESTVDLDDSSRKISVEGTPDLSEQAFFNWLISDGGVSEQTSRQYISGVHSVEKIYQMVFGIRKKLLDYVSADNAKQMIESVITQKQYIEANERRNNGFGIALSKYAQFADISIEELETVKEKKNYNPPNSTGATVVRIVDFDEPQKCTYYKPCSLTLNGIKRSVKNWRELYSEFLFLLYTDRFYHDVLNSLIGQPLYGQRIDFADNLLADKLRNIIIVSTDFYAEGNLSAIDIIKHIKCLMELCSIDDSNLIIEYIAYDNTVSTDENSNTVYSEIINKNNSQAEKNEAYESKFIPFEPDTSRPFVLKDAIIEILSSNSSEVNELRKESNGLSSHEILNIIKKYYGRNVTLFEISKLMMTDKSFKLVGRSWQLSGKKTSSIKDEIITDNVQNTTASSSEYDVGSASTAASDEISIKNILEVMKENSGKLQYEAGFGAYEIKSLLYGKCHTSVEEEDIEALMSKCPDLTEIEDGYYALADTTNKQSDTKYNVPIAEVHYAAAPEFSSENTVPNESNSNAGHIVLNINGTIIRAYDYSDAIIKVCEFAINCRPFRMARIAGYGLSINGQGVFYRKSVPVDGYNKLTNGLQVMSVDTLSELQLITAEVKKYCQIDDDMITIISM